MLSRCPVSPWSPAPNCPTSIPTTDCSSRRWPRSGSTAQAGRVGRPGRRLDRVRPGRAALDLGLRAAPGRSSWPGRARVPRLANPADVVGLEHRQAVPGRAGARRACPWCPPPGWSPATRRGPPPPDRRVGDQAGGQRGQPGHRPVRPGRPGAPRRWPGRTWTGWWAPGRVAMVQPYLPAVDGSRGDGAAVLRRGVQPRDPQGSDARRAGPRRGRAVPGGGDPGPGAHRGAAGGRGAGAGRCPGRPAVRPGRPDPLPGRRRRCWSSWNSPSRRCSSNMPRARPSASPRRSPAGCRPSARVVWLRGLATR